MAFAPKGFKSFSLSMPIWLREKLFQKKFLFEKLRQHDKEFKDIKKIKFSEHHYSHAASAFYPSPFKEAVVQQVGRSLQFFYSSSSFNSVDHIFLAGGVAATDGLVSLVENRLATPTTIANPFTNMSMSPRVNAVALSGDAPAMMVAAGLALRAMD